jgi:hypothetical protein
MEPATRRSLLEGGRSGDLASRRLPVGNMINRVVGVLALLPFLQPMAAIFARLESNAARMAARCGRHVRGPALQNMSVAAQSGAS